MLRLHGVVGEARESEMHRRLHALEHVHGVEYVMMAEADAGRRRLRLTTDKGTDCAISVDDAGDLRDGAVLLIEADRAIVLRVGAARCWRLKPRDAAAALQLGWHAGNLHWRVRFEGEILTVPLDAPLETYRARIRTLLDEGAVTDLGDA